MTSRTPECQTILIEPLKGWERLNLHDVWEYRELLYFFIWRNLKVSYARTKLGFGWAVLKPMLTVAVFTLIFGWLTQVPSDGIPYPLFVFPPCSLGSCLPVWWPVRGQAWLPTRI